jgi:hypothetical protein
LFLFRKTLPFLSKVLLVHVSLFNLQGTSRPRGQLSNITTARPLCQEVFFIFQKKHAGNISHFLRTKSGFYSLSENDKKTSWKIIQILRD